MLLRGMNQSTFSVLSVLSLQQNSISRPRGPSEPPPPPSSMSVCAFVCLYCMSPLSLFSSQRLVYVLYSRVPVYGWDGEREGRHVSDNQWHLLRIHCCTFTGMCLGGTERKRERVLWGRPYTCHASATLLSIFGRVGVPILGMEFANIMGHGSNKWDLGRMKYLVNSVPLKVEWVGKRGSISCWRTEKDQRYKRRRKRQQEWNRITKKFKNAKYYLSSKTNNAFYKIKFAIFSLIWFLKYFWVLYRTCTVVS